MQRPLLEEARLHEVDFYGANPLPTYARMRTEAPVLYHAAGRFWALSRWNDIRFVGLNPQLFSSEGPLFISEWLYPELFKRRSTPIPGTSIYFSKDPPSHSEFRQQFNPCLRQRNLAGIEGVIRQTIRESIERIRDGETLDAVRAISIPTPILVIADLLGVDRGDRESFIRWSNAHIELRGTDPTSEKGRQLIEESQRLLSYMSEIQARRQGSAGNDLMSFISGINIGGEPLTPGSQALIGYQLLIAGNETIRSAISGALLAFAQRPAEWVRLREDPKLLPTAVDEILRWSTPVIHFGRVALEDVEIRDKLIRRGDFVVGLFEAGNHDEEVFQAGDAFDIARAPNPHLSFSYGEHFCPGIYLTRIELRIILEELMAAFRGWEVAGSPVRSPSIIVNSLASLALTFHRLQS